MSRFDQHLFKSYTIDSKSMSRKNINLKIFSLSFHINIKQTLSL